MKKNKLVFNYFFFHLKSLFFVLYKKKIRLYSELKNQLLRIVF